jgi:hypothetical protein
MVLQLDFWACTPFVVIKLGYPLVPAPPAVALGPLLHSAGSGGAARLPGPPWAQPACRALPGVDRGGMARGGAPRPLGPAPWACAGTSAPAPGEAARGVSSGRGLPLP